MPETQQDQPLWWLMCDAYCEATDSVARDTDTIAVGTAAEIRAVADWLRKRQVNEVGRDPASFDDVIDWLNEQAIIAEVGQ